MNHPRLTPQAIRAAYLNGHINEAARDWALDNLTYLARPMRLLTTNTVKTNKGKKKGYTTAVLYLQPAAKVTARTICPAAKMAGCEEGCLISSGRLGMTNGQMAATKRTILWAINPDLFEASLVSEIEKLHAKHGDTLAVRLNGTSDIDWHSLIALLPGVQFYDYTKVYARVERNSLPNYALTYSGSAYSAKSREITARAIKAGHNVALAFNTKQAQGEFELPAELADFDETDLRFLDAKGCTGALSRKGSSKATRQAEHNQASFFFTPETYQDMQNLIATDRG
jgi:hypothetical protein